MKIRISDIISSGLEFEEQSLPGGIDIVDDFVDPGQPVKVKGRLDRIDDFILARLKVTYTVNMVCARCLEGIHKDVSVECEFDIEYDQGDKYIDIGIPVREEILLGYQLHTLCNENCNGICPDCGADLNKEKCMCGKKEIKPSQFSK